MAALPSPSQSHLGKWTAVWLSTFSRHKMKLLSLKCTRYMCLKEHEFWSQTHLGFISSIVTYYLSDLGEVISPNWASVSSSVKWTWWYLPHRVLCRWDEIMGMKGPAWYHISKLQNEHLGVVDLVRHEISLVFSAEAEDSVIDVGITILFLAPSSLRLKNNYKVFLEWPLILSVWALACLGGAERVVQLLWRCKLLLTLTCLVSNTVTLDTASFKEIHDNAWTWVFYSSLQQSSLPEWPSTLQVMKL